MGLAIQTKTHHMTTYSVFSDGVRVALCSVEPNESLKEAEISEVNTFDGHRRKGYARYLLQNVISSFKEGWTLRLYAYADNVAAIALYESVGFAITHSDKDFHYMEKVI